MGDCLKNGFVLAQENSEFIEFIFMIIVMAVATLGGLLKNKKQQKGRSASQKPLPSIPNKPSMAPEHPVDEIQKAPSVEQQRLEFETKPLLDREAGYGRHGRKIRSPLQATASTVSSPSIPSRPKTLVQELPEMEMDGPQLTSGPSSAILKALAGDQLRDAIIMKEILDQPLSLRDYP